VCQTHGPRAPTHIGGPNDKNLKIYKKKKRKPFC